MSRPIVKTHCSSCVELKKYVDQQGELISQLMRMIAQTHEKVVVMERNVHKITPENEVEYVCDVSEPSSDPSVID
ncbi:hypothetical protein [Aquisalibacillus elongatus]|uniref:Uncharacterized protein n=1 Tax=Aquisalibacillus elongatus TaxID=485577 RepID=A0A3N5BX73_9BACI|nr:hypothetical protein [Aquisalibacillus elongatus]RPF54368.1 hypothetical protein EDC24_1566 [Aquisalibacillus elongatus]